MSQESFAEGTCEESRTHETFEVGYKTLRNWELTLALVTFLVNHGIFSNFVHGGEVNVNVWFLNRFHIWITLYNQQSLRFGQGFHLTWCDSATANGKFRSETFQKSRVLDEFRHAIPKHLLGLFLAFTAREEQTPKSINLIFQVFGMLQKSFGVLSEFLALLFCVYLSGAVISRN